MTVSLLLFMITALVTLTFACLNAEPVVVHYFVGVRQVPLSVLLVGFLCAGILIGIGMCLPMIFRFKKKIAQLSE